MKRFLITLYFVILSPSIVIYCQVDDLKESYLEAESYFLFEEFSEALPLYLKVHRAMPENDNINYRIGICFLNDPYQKDKSIRYLEEACQNINPKYKENNFKETTAPPEAFFYLGHAYLINNQIEKALENYKHFREILDENIYDVELVEEQIKICNTAKSLMKKPVDYDVVPLPPYINTRFRDRNPILSGDGKRLVFVSEQRFYDATFFSEKVDGNWQPPRNIVPELGVDGDVYPTYLSYDGNLMIIYRNDDFIGNLYQSEYIDGRWTNMKKIGSEISTKYWESHGSLSRDGNTLYFTSNRKGGFGGLDIYKSERQADGSWGHPVNLGETINTRYNEETPFITENEQYLYFSSYGHLNMGGYDVFYSKKKPDGQWDIPVNMGYPINTTDDDVFYLPVNNGLNAIYALIRDEGQGQHDIYYLNVYSDNNPRMYMVSGYLDPDNGKITSEDNVIIYLVDRETGDTVDTSYPDLASRTFELKAPRGNYDLVITSNSFNNIVQHLDINNESDKAGIKLDDNLALVSKPAPPKILTGENSRIELEDSIFHVMSGEPLKIRMRLEKESILYLKTYLDTLLIDSDTLTVDKRRYTYEMIPVTGLNIIALTQVEENGDISNNKVYIYAKGDIKAEPLEKDIEVSPSIKTKVTDTKQDTIDEPLQKIVNNLAKYADGNLQQTLEQLSLKDLNINSAADLLNVLEKIGEEKGYTLQDIDRAVANSLSGGDAEILHGLLSEYATGNLKSYLEEIDINSLEQSTSDQYMIQLRKEEESQSYTKSDINSTMAGAMDKVNNEAELFRLQMLQNADGPLKDLLETLDLKALNINSIKELMNYLRSRAEELGIDTNDIEVLKVLTETNNSAEQLLESLLSKYEGPLFEYLNNLDLDKTGITTAEELIAYLLDHAEEIGVDPEYLLKLITGEAGDFTPENFEKDKDTSGGGSRNGLKVGGGLILLGFGLVIFLVFLRRKK